MTTRSQHLKTLWVALLPLVAFLVLAQDASSGIATQHRRGLMARSLDQVLELPDQEIDLATACLLISKQGYKDLYHTAIDVDGYRKRLDQMAEALSVRLRGKTDPRRIVWTVNDYFFRQLGFTAAPTTENPRDLFLNSVLDRRRGHCLSLSVLMMSIAERIGLPFYGVAAPRHFFVRYEDAGRRINIETTEQGRSYPDSEYAVSYDVPEGSSFYMKNIGKKGVLACFLNNLAAVYGRNGMADEALWAAGNAVASYPALADSHNNLGLAYAQKGLLDKAISECHRALAINHDLAEAHNNLAVAYYLKKEFKLAVEHSDRAMELGYEVDARFLKRLERYR